MFTRLIASLRGLARRRRVDGEIDEELRDHLEHEMQRHRARGLPAGEARRLALRDIGGLTQTAESVREVRSTWLDAAWRDLTYAARVLRRSPRFTITALTLLVLAIGSTTAIFSITYAVLLRPLPYSRPDRLVSLAEKEGTGIVWPTFEDWQRRATSFDGLASSLTDAVIVTSGPVPRRFESRSVTASFFRVLGVTSFRGRLFDESDARPDAPASVVVSHAFWMRELGGDPAAVGRTIALNPDVFTVIGVLPADFRYVTPADVYMLLDRQVAANFRGMKSRTTRTNLYGVARLRPGVSVTVAQTEMRAIAAALDVEYGNKSGSDVQVLPLADRVVQDVAPTLTVLAGAVALLLLIACVNLASLLLNRSAARAHELSIRAAIGGSRWSLIRQLLVEQVLLVGTGGVLGALAGAAILTALVGMAPRNMPRIDEIHLDLSVLAWTTLFSCACALVFGVVPALKASGIGGQALVVRAGRGSTNAVTLMRRGLMVAEIAVAMVLLAGSGLMVHTMLRLSRVDPGFDPHNLQTVMFSLEGPTWPNARKQASYDLLVERLRAVPGVENAALTYSLPILGSNWWSVFVPAGTTGDHWTAVGEFPNAAMVPVTDTYFETLKIPMIRGRSFNRSDTPGSLPVAIVNSSSVRKYWPNEDPIGKQIQLGYPAQPYGPWRTIVGVVGDIKQHGVDQDTPRQVFLPIVQQPRTTNFAIVRTRAPLSASSIESAIQELDRGIPVFNDRTVDQVMGEASSRRRVAMMVLSVFGCVAVLLAAIGLYGVIAQGVSERRQEIGVRVALGATQGQVVWIFLRSGLVVVAVGVGGGAIAAVSLAQSLKSLVFGVAPTDAVTLGAVTALLAVVALAACYLPARAAARLDPLVALRQD